MSKSRSSSTTKSANGNNNDTSSTTSTPKRPFEYEFGGPIGAFLTILFLPMATILLSHFATVGEISLTFLSEHVSFIESGSELYTVITGGWSWTGEVGRIVCPHCYIPVGQVEEEEDEEVFHWKPIVCAFCGIMSWFLFQVLLERFLPADIIPGTPLRDGKNTRLLYRINGHLAYWVTLLLLQIGWPYYDDNVSRWQFGKAPLGILYDYYMELAFASIVFSILLSFYMYFKSFTRGALLAEGGTSGNIIYDFFMGRELNPRFGDGENCTFDWKEFCELRPGLIGWTILNLAMATKQYELRGYISGSMILINVFQNLYVWDALYQERAILTTMDITTDGFGYMLVFGDLTWVPFTYGLQAKYLVDHDPDLGYMALLGVLATNVVGYTIFRCANSQKDAFRRDPNDPTVKHLSYMSTKRGTRLLTSGWWGLARKINYTGDWFMGLSWCLLCGFDSIVPYYYAIYFAILLIHRSIRDDHACSVKYGKDWEVYRRKVPYRFIPGII